MLGIARDTKDDLVTVIGFSRTPRLLADGMSGDQAAKLKDLVNQSASEGGTNLEEAIKLAEQLADRRKLSGAQNRIVLFTDGAANLGDAKPERLAEKVKQLRQKGIAFALVLVARGRGLLLLPGLVILPRFFGLNGVWMAIPISDLGSALITGAWLVVELRRLDVKHLGERGTPRPEDTVPITMELP